MAHNPLHALSNPSVGGFGFTSMFDLLPPNVSSILPASFMNHMKAVPYSPPVPRTSPSNMLSSFMSNAQNAISSAADTASQYASSVTNAASQYATSAADAISSAAQSIASAVPANLSAAFSTPATSSSPPPLYNQEALPPTSNPLLAQLASPNGQYAARTMASFQGGALGRSRAALSQAPQGDGAPVGPPDNTTGGISNQTLLIGGGVALAGIAAVVLLK